MKDVAAFVHRYLRSVALSGCARFSRTGLGNRVEIIAHRGASHAAPENTLASVSLAWQMEADAVEVDVHLSKDNRIVAIHDPWTDRTGGVRLEVANTIAHHLRRLDVGSHKHHQYARERIPFLEEVLDQKDIEGFSDEVKNKLLLSKLRRRDFINAYLSILQTWF